MIDPLFAHFQLPWYAYIFMAPILVVSKVAAKVKNIGKKKEKQTDK